MGVLPRSQPLPGTHELYHADLADRLRREKEVVVTKRHRGLETFQPLNLTNPAQLLIYSVILQNEYGIR